MTGPIVTSLLTDEMETEALRDEWLDLWLRCPAATTFQHPDWLIAWWRVFHPGALRVCVARAAGAVVAVAPLYLETAAHGPRLLPIGISLSDHGDVLVSPGEGARALNALATGLCSGRADWSRLDWDDLAPEASALQLRSCPALATAEEGLGAPCPVLPLPASVAELGAVVPARKLRKLRMARHRAARRETALVRHTPSTCSAFLDQLERLHSARWRSRGEAGVFEDGRPAAFLRAATPRLMDGGFVIATTLIIDGVVAGAFLGFRRGVSASAYMGGFDPAFSFESPGTILLGDAIEQAVVSGASEFNFLRGAEPYKYEWGAVDRFNRRLSLRPREAARAA